MAEGPAAPPLGCRHVSQHVVGHGLSPARLASSRAGLWMASYVKRDGELHLARFHVEPGAPAPKALDELPLGQAGPGRRVPPAVSAGESVWMAAIDDQGTLVAFADAEQTAPRRVEIAKHVDRRFPPALRSVGHDGALIAWTKGDATRMHVEAAHVVGTRVQRQQVTPPGHGATAPRFVLGIIPLTLLMLDAHAGVSPLLAVAFDGAGRAGPATVWRPVSQPYAPPSLVGVSIEGHPVHVAYTAIGNAATAAVGLVRVDTPDPPEALLPGRGYALLAIDAALGPHHAVFAFDAPIGSQPAPDLEVHVRVWDGEHIGPAWVQSAEGKSATRPAIAYDAPRDLFAVAHVRGDALLLDWLRCDG